MSPTIPPLAPADYATFLTKLREALAIIKPAQVTLADADRRRLAPGAMGRASIPFAQEAGKLFAAHSEVLRRAITDEMLAGYPALLTAFEEADAADEIIQTLHAIMSTRKLVTGAAAMSMARDGYTDGQNDKGRTPGVKAIIDRMALRFDQSPPDDTAS